MKKIFLHNYILVGLLFFGLSQTSFSQDWGGDDFETDIIVGAERINSYLPFLVQKNIGIVMNHTSMVGESLLVDTLLGHHLKVKKIFTPEHGLRGTADAGKEIQNGIDPQTKLPVISLYGENKKPSVADLAGINVMIFDLQDVGVRFYTYISTMHYVMQACAENNIKLIILDRPNPNGHYVDGPVLEMSHKSFVGLHPIPVVHGMTVGELAHMINEEGWLDEGLYTKKRCDIEVITCSNYDHTKEYILPVNPSPNLPNQTSIYLYPSLCLFEGTDISVGRGTHFPFQVYGHPNLKAPFEFIPKSIPGKSTSPKHMNQKCYGYDLRGVEKDQFNLNYLIETYKAFPEKDDFFNSFFRKLVGNDDIQKWIEEGKTAEVISKSWMNELKEFKEKRKKYLLYKDFE